jgi:hypothetical protein
VTGEVRGAVRNVAREAEVEEKDRGRAAENAAQEPAAANEIEGDPQKPVGPDGGSSPTN